MTKAKKRRILALWDRRCAYCTEPAGTIDHVVPKVRGGTDDDANLVAACVRCQTLKGGHMPNDPLWIVALIAIRAVQRIKAGARAVRVVRAVIGTPEIPGVVSQISPPKWRIASSG